MKWSSNTFSHCPGCSKVMLQSFESSPWDKVLEKAGFLTESNGEMDTRVNAFKVQLDKLSGDDFVPFNLAYLWGRGNWGFAYPRVCFFPILRLGYKLKQHL